MKKFMDYKKHEDVPLTADSWCGTLQNDAVLTRMPETIKLVKILLLKLAPFWQRGE